MAGTSRILPLRHLRKGALAGLLAAAMLAAGGACSRPRDLDLSLDRPTDHQLFRVRIASLADPVPISKIHQWSLHLSDRSGAPLSGAELHIDGGMPEHGHGLPTAPRVEAGNAPGDYVVQGMKFSMTGWWVLKLDVAAADGSADAVTFNLIL